MSQTSRERLDLYDRAGKALGRTVYRGSPLQKGEYHLVVQIWIRNRIGEYLIQKRSTMVAQFPGIWATTAGAVLAGETSRAAAIRELTEELGITVPASEIEQVFATVGENSLGSVWMLERNVHADEIRLQTEEVAEVKWATLDEIRSKVSQGAFLDYGRDYFNAIAAWTSLR